MSGPAAAPAAEVALGPGHGLALRVAEGELLTLEQVGGGREVALASLVAADPGERLSMFTSVTVNHAWQLRPGAVLLSADSRPLWDLVADTAGDASTGGGWCRRHAGGSCEASLHAALADLGRPPGAIGPDAAFRPFLPVAYERDLTWAVGAPRASAGDRVALRARCDQLVALAHCATGAPGAPDGEVRVRVER